MHRLLIVLMMSLVSGPAFAEENFTRATERIRRAADGDVRIEQSRVSGNVRLIRFTKDAEPKLKATTSSSRALEFLSRHADAFGISDPATELRLSKEYSDFIGHTHVTFEQRYSGIPVVGAVLRTHEDQEGHLHTVNGTFIPGIDLDTTPTLSRDSARAAAFAVVAKGRNATVTARLKASEPSLEVLHKGLVRGMPGAIFLVWRVEVGDNKSVRDFVFLDAHGGLVVERISGIHELNRVIHRQTFGNQVWTEGDTFPYSGSTSSHNEEVNELIRTSEDVYTLFDHLSNGSFLSWDGRNGIMHSVQNLQYDECPNAFWNGQSTNFCAGMVTDDIAAHEWTHAYTGRTHQLIYLWQPGALNEAYSDIFGEVVDLINGRGTDSPGPLRTDGSCSSFAGSSPSQLTVHSPASVAGDYVAAGAVFNPSPPWSVRADVELADDAAGTTSDACQPLQGFSSGNIALVDRGDCFFRDKVSNALNAGASGVIVVNNDGDGILTMGGDGGLLNIPAVLIGESNGRAIEEALSQGVEATLSQPTTSDVSVRWLIGEDSRFGALRDMWNPACFDDPASVSDGRYFCDDDDSGGVHTNCGVPTHAFALAADGGTFNGHLVEGIGLTKAAHIWWRAMSEYQVPTTAFPQHADLVELSCSDLIGASLADLASGNPSPEAVTAADCSAIAEAMAAVEMRADPAQCRFVPLLEANPPSVAGSTVLFSETFGEDPLGHAENDWRISNSGVYAEYDPRDWVWTPSPPNGSEGDGAMFALDSFFIGDCHPGSDDQSGVMHLDTPPITMPEGYSGVTLVVDHYVATESRYDGGLLAASVNEGPFEPVPLTSFVHNFYSSRLQSASAGNTNPLAGLWAFNGTDGGSLGGSWGQSQLDLRVIAQPGQSIRLRFSFGVDGCNGIDGWYLDRVQVLKNAAGPRQPSGRAGG
ncbi:MAG: M4 family metallopeptidase [Thermoanaerobaculales bacterium]|nr:M4 family metallopeptidase [Thermoanaerobaculales bacterium]